MHFGSIDFPKRLVDAQRTGELVGAGISIPAPSGLPSFEDLAKELAAGTAERAKNEPIDRFLGRLVPDLDIHRRARDRLSKPESRPNPLHRDLLRLFSGSADVRLVTSNFDDHFATAAMALYPGECPEVFVAPALPSGSDFSGIVHLHGSVTKEPKRMVLTDRDFGRAYLTEGWARRFLQELFAHYVVLFVGYSHSDPVVHHLARGLPPSAQYSRFALTEAGNDDFWKFLGVCPLPYPKQRGKKRHADLGAALSKWAEHAWETPIGSLERIKRIVAGPPPVAGEELDFVEEALGDICLTRFFVQSAQGIEWLRWIENRDAFLRLFRDNELTTELDGELACWFASRFACDHCGTALELVRKNGSVLSRACRMAIAREIWGRMYNGQTPSAVGRWVPVLIRNHPKSVPDYLEYILDKCRYPEESTSALLLFTHLLRPVMRLKPSASRWLADPGDEPEVEAELETVGDGHWIHQAWCRLFETNLDAFAGELATVVTAHLEEATRIYKPYGQDYGSWDPISIGSQTIDEPTIGLERSGLVVLVDVARGVLAWFTRNSPERASGFIEAWTSSSSITLRRLAIYGVAISESLTCDEKLRWLLRHRLIYRLGSRGEALLVLEAAFQNASAETKTDVVKVVAAGPAGNMEELDRDCMIYGTLSKLSKADSQCDLVRKEIAIVLGRQPDLARPPEAQAMEAAQQPFNVRYLLSTPPEKNARRTVELLASR
jgi:hypothetical protein